MALLLGTNVADEMGRRIRMPVDVAVEARNPQAWAIGAAIVDVIELLLRKGRQEQAQAIELLRIQEALEEVVVVVGGDELPLGHVALVRLRGQEDRRWKLGQEVLGQIEVEIEARQIAPGLPGDLVNREAGEEHAALRLLGM